MKKHGTYTDNNFIYSVDLMFMYAKTIKSKKIKVSDLIHKLKTKNWDNLSPLEVIKNKSLSSSNYERIRKANLRYPIIIDAKNNIIDGMHRLSKAYLLNKKYIRAYVFDKDVMKKFIIGKKKGKEWKASDWNYYEKLTQKDFDKLYKDRFT